MTYRSFYTSVAALAVLLVGSAGALATGGVTQGGAGPNYASGANEEDFEDMRVKVLGGHVRMNRRWDGEQWVWNYRWNPIQSGKQVPLYTAMRSGSNAEPAAPGSGGFGSDSSSGGGGTITISTGNYSQGPSFLLRNKVAYRSSGGSSDQLIYKNQQIYTLERNLGENIIWRDKRGNLMHYSDEGLLQHYQDNNGVRVTLVYNEFQNVRQVKDHQGNAVVTYTWQANPHYTSDHELDKDPTPWSRQRLHKLSDNNGREVVYGYNSSGQLDSVTDVRGKVWTYQYSGKTLKSQTDPENNVSRFSIDADGRLKSRFDADGVGGRYSYGYDSSKKEYYQSMTDGAGTVTETWFNSHGMAIRQDIQGETQFSAIVELSDQTLGTQNLTKLYKPLSNVGFKSSGTGGSYGGGKLSASAGLNHSGCFYWQPCRSGSGGKPIPYVKKRIVTDARGYKTTYHYDQWKNVIKVEHPDGASQTSSYNLAYSVVDIHTDELGLITDYDYDDLGNLTQIVEAKGTADERTTNYTYYPQGHLNQGELHTVTTGASARGLTALATTTYSYDQYGNLTQVVQPVESGVNRTMNWSDFDAMGNAKTYTDGRANALIDAAQPGYVWSKTFDNVGNLLTDKNPLGQGSTYVWDKAGRLESVTGANAATSTLTTNAAGLPVTITDADNAVSKIEYDKANRPTAIIDANTNSFTRSYDGYGRLKTVTDGEKNTTTYNYKINLLDSIHYPTYSESMGFDKRERLDSSLQKANNKDYLREYGYDVGGNLDKSTDAEKNAEGYKYDKLNRLIKITDAKNGVTEFVYDARDNLLEVIDPENRKTVYTYNLADEQVSETKPKFLGSNKQRVYGYDSNGNLITADNPQQERVKNTYDNANRLAMSEVFAQKGDSLPIKVTDYSYNAKGEYTGYTVSTGGAEASKRTPDIKTISEVNAYNALGQLESVTLNYPGFSKSYSYTYYPNGLKKTYTNAENIVYTYYYNKNNQLQAVHIPGDGQIGYTDFQWLAPQTLLLPGGTKLTYRYDDFLRIKERVLLDPAETNLAQAIYEYDLESNITSIESEQGQFVFDYDTLYRLTGADYPTDFAASNDELFEYDGVGNRTLHNRGQSSLATLTPEAETLEYNSHNQLKSSDSSVGPGAVFTYNDNGHTKTKLVGGVLTEYFYNREERLIRVAVAGSTVGEYGYNPYGQRIFKTVGGVTTWFLYNDEGMAGEYLSSGALVKEYHFKPYATWMTEPLFVRSTAASGDAVTGVFYYQNDHLGTPQRLLDKSGAVVWMASYSAFGEASVSVSEVTSNLRFPGQYFDGESGLHWNMYRDYDAELGRYVQEDPVGLWGGINVYGYVDANPIVNFDPNGLYKCTCSVSKGGGGGQVVARKVEGGLEVKRFKYNCTCRCNPRSNGARGKTKYIKIIGESWRDKQNSQFPYGTEGNKGLKFEGNPSGKISRNWDGTTCPKFDIDTEHKPLWGYVEDRKMRTKKSIRDAMDKKCN